MQQLTINTLRQELARLQHDHGDLPVILTDADTGWNFMLKANHLYIEKFDNTHGKALMISVDYDDQLVE